MIPIRISMIINERTNGCMKAEKRLLTESPHSDTAQRSLLFLQDLPRSFHRNLPRTNLAETESLVWICAPNQT